MDSRESRIVQNGEPVSTGLDRLLQPYRCQGVQSNPEPKADSVKTSDEKEDGVDGEFQRNEYGVDLTDVSMQCNR